MLVTSMHRRFFEGDQVQNTLGDYPEAVRRVAEELDVPLIDLHAMSEAFYEALGPSSSKRAFVHYPAGTFPDQKEAFKDNSHFSPYGGFELARCVVEGIRQKVPDLAEHLRDGIGPYDPASPGDPDDFDLPSSSLMETETPEGS